MKNYVIQYIYDMKILTVLSILGGRTSEKFVNEESRTGGEERIG